MVCGRGLVFLSLLIGAVGCKGSGSSDDGGASDARPAADAALRDAATYADAAEVPDAGEGPDAVSFADAVEYAADVEDASEPPDASEAPDAVMIPDAAGPRDASIGSDGGPLGSCLTDNDCWIGEVCRHTMTSTTRPSVPSGPMICKLLEDNSNTGDPCQRSSDDVCFISGRLCPTTPGRYGTQECHDGQFSGYYCDATMLPLCYDSTKSCFAGLITPTPFFCALPCYTSADCPADLACLADETLSQTSTVSARGSLISYCGPPSCLAGTRDSYCSGSITVLPGGPSCPSGTTYNPLSNTTHWDCVCDPGSTNPDCLAPTCTRDSDCGAPMESCVNRSCVRSSCASDADCGLGQICGVLGKTGRGGPAPAQRFCMSPGATPIGGVCAEGGDCASGQCYAGNCVEPCRTNSDCPGRECVAGPIVPGDPPFCSSRLHCGNCAASQYCDPWRQCQLP